MLGGEGEAWVISGEFASLEEIPHSAGSLLDLAGETSRA